jgi:hypothetical protein
MEYLKEYGRLHMVYVGAHGVTRPTSAGFKVTMRNSRIVETFHEPVTDAPSSIPSMLSVESWRLNVPLTP